MDNRARNKGKEKVTEAPPPCTKNLSRVIEAARYYHEHIPEKVKWEIANAEKEIREFYDTYQHSEEFEDLADWVVDPGDTRSRMTLYH